MNEQLAGLRPGQRDALRIAGAIAFASGIFVLLSRKGEDWADFPILITLLVPCVLLYGLGMGALRLGPGDEPEVPARADGDRLDRADHGLRRLPAWRTVAFVLGIVFVPLVLFQLIELLGGDTDKPGWVFITLLLSAVAAAYAAAVHGLRVGALLAGLFLIGSWLALCEALFDPSATTIRWLFVIIGAILAAAAWVLHQGGRREAPELVTAAGIAGVAAGLTAFGASAGQLFANAVASAFGAEEESLTGGIEQRQEWDAFLLVLALVLIWYGVRAGRRRGPVYVGAVALFAFIISTGAELADRLAGEEATGDAMGWPVLLIVLGAAALAAGLLAGGDRGAPATAEAAPTEPMPPAAPPPGPPPPGQP